MSTRRILPRLTVGLLVSMALLLASTLTAAAAAPIPTPPAGTTTWCLIVKSVASGSDKPLAGAIFTITDAAGHSTSLTSGKDGNTRLCNLAAGTYSVVEAKAPKGYLRDSAPKSVPINDATCLSPTTCATLTISNQPPSTAADDLVPAQPTDALPYLLAGLGLLYLAYFAADRMGMLGPRRNQVKVDHDQS